MVSSSGVVRGILRICGIMRPVSVRVQPSRMFSCGDVIGMRSSGSCSSGGKKERRCGKADGSGGWVDWRRSLAAGTGRDVKREDVEVEVVSERGGESGVDDVFPISLN